MLKEILKHVIKGIVYSILLSILGMGFSLIKGYSLIKGAYIFVFTGGILTMMLSIALLIGTPNIRKKYFFMNEDEKKNNPLFGGEGIAPALMGIVIVIIGFILEAITHLD
ncbi:hypothetical protein SAMN02745883_01617 [Caminicella sporogenes DSM 14501]|uniref:Uncharacterized protein n=1 Tax=Caminicella sporogenes DSM 14501 TaxID=1121266 RepID=A0A1M6QUY7_9FIRM|nr:hypothetical protein [Caminicella sporogenes]RKD20904.1 hypothetical protein BET04_08715 [Caminicella sporogenes]SHK23920.1 hypothetical protein SAMN02745883_01617 [Caminicella sporogenes DSM 14501]